MKLMLLIIPAIHRTLNPIANGPSSWSDWPPERVRDEVDAVAEDDREQGQPELAGELPARPQVQGVVDHAERRRERAAEQQADELGQPDVGRHRRRSRRSR